MASEDMREDLIENEPSTSVDDSVDEKTWSWLVSRHQSTSWAVECRLHAKIAAIDFL